MHKKLAPISEQVHKLVQSIFDPSALDDMIENANESAEAVNDHLNDNASKDEFKRLWEEINHRYVYTVHYDSDELIQKAVVSINKNLRVTELKYVVTTGEQGTDDLDFTGDQHTRTQALKEVSTSDVPYDLVGEIAKGATLTRRTVVRLLNSRTPISYLNISELPLNRKETGNTLETRGLTYSYTFYTIPKNAHLDCKGTKLFSHNQRVRLLFALLCINAA